MKLMRSIGIVALICMLGAKAWPATYEVASIADLRTRINAAVAGDIIILKNGVYATTSSIGVNRVGTAANPILIKAETVGGVEIGGTHGFSLNSGARYVHIQGFKFTHTSGRDAINLNANFCRFTRNTFECPGDGNYLVVAGDDAEVDRNEFRNKSTVGNMIDVRGTGSQIARRVWIHHNYFHDFSNAGENGAETIRFGLSGLSLSTSNGLIEHNLFINCRGENELISVKASFCTTRYNTILNSSGAQLTQRHGNDCLIYGNYLKGTAGIRIFGDRHQVFSNYMESNSTGIDMGNGGGEVADGDPLTSHDRPDNVVVSFNTFVNNSTHYRMGGRTDGLGALNITVANNIYQGGGSMASISSTAPHTGTWSGNIRWNTSSAGNMPSSGYTTVNPMLAADAFGVFRLQAGSPAIDAAVGTYAAVTIDMDGQARSGAKDKGADEFSQDTVLLRQPLTVADVGPASGDVIVPPPPTAGVLLEVEDLIINEQSPAGITRITNETPFSGGESLMVDSASVGSFVVVRVPNVEQGSYEVRLGVKTHPSRGIIQAAADDGTGLFASIGDPFDLYAPSSEISYAEILLGSMIFDSAGDKLFRFTAVGRNAASNGLQYTMNFDFLRLIKQSAASDVWMSLQ